MSSKGTRVQESESVRIGLIDYTKLELGNTGKALEDLCRRICEVLELNPTWTGIGQDEGRDLILTQIIDGPVSRFETRWLVSCKDNSKSGKSVYERDIDPIPGKMKQHKTHGYLLVTTTTASSGLKKHIDSLDRSEGGEYLTCVWDRAKLDGFLLDDRFSKIFMSFLPNSFKAYQDLGAPDVVTQLSSFVPIDELMKVWDIIKPHVKKPKSELGDALSAYETAQQLPRLIADEQYDHAMALIDGLEQHVVRLLIEAIITTGEESEYKPPIAFFKHLFVNSNNEDTKLNLFQLLDDKHYLKPDLRIHLAKSLDQGALEIVYELEIDESINNLFPHDISFINVNSELDQLGTAFNLEDILIVELDFDTKNADGIGFEATASISVTVFLGSPSDFVSSSHSFPLTVWGVIGESSIELTESIVDTSSYFTGS